MEKMKKKSVHLPEEVITEILLRSPVKFLLRCKSVSKSWRTLVSDPRFASSHFQLTAPKLFFIDSNAQKALSIDFNASLYNDSSFSSHSLAFLPPESHPRIIGSCRGFLFLQCYAFFYLWNPSTGVSKQIPTSPIVSKYRTFILLCGFMYDSSMDDYFVVLGSYKYKGLNDLEIFSLKDNRWKQIEVDSNLPYYRTTARLLDGPIVGSILNDFIHWIVYNYETEWNVIIAFDLKEMRISEIALPEQFSRHSCREHYCCRARSSLVDYDLFVYDGLINACIVKMQTLEIWVMQEYRVYSSWIKTIHFSFDPAPILSPIYFSNCGEIVGTVGDGGLAKFDDEGYLIEHCSYGDFHFDRSEMIIYTESLFSLLGGL